MTPHHTEGNTMKIGTNGPHYPGYAPCPLSANLAHHGEYDNGKNYNVTGVYEGGFISGLGINDLPTGEYLVVNDSDSTATVRTMSGHGHTLMPRTSRQLLCSTTPIAFVVTGAHAHRVGIYPPGSLAPGITNPKHNDFFLNQHAKAALGPFESFRWNPQAVNGSSSTDWSDAPNDWNNPRTHLAFAKQLGKPTWVQLPHLWTIYTIREYLIVIADAMRDDPTIPPITIEYGNEVWNSRGAFLRAHRDVGAMYGYNLPGYNSQPWVLSWTGYGTMAGKIASVFQELSKNYPHEILASTSNPRIRLACGSQAANEDVSRQILKAAMKEFVAADIWIDCLTIAPYLSIDGGLAQHTPADYYRKSLDAVANYLPKQAAIAKEFGVKLTCYEGGPDSLVRRGHPRYDEIQDFEDNSPTMRTIMEEFLALLSANGVTEYHHYQIVRSPSDPPWNLIPSCYDRTGNVKHRALMDCIEYAPSPVDLDRDGHVTHADLKKFSALFLAKSVISDWNGDGAIDNGDIGAFIADFLKETGGHQ